MTENRVQDWTTVDTEAWLDGAEPPEDPSLAKAYWCEMNYFMEHTASGGHPDCSCPEGMGHNDPRWARRALLKRDHRLAEIPIAIYMATQEDIDALQANASIQESAAVRFYGKLVAVLDEYGTATVPKGIDKEKIESLIQFIGDNDIWPIKYNPDNPNCYICGYLKSNHHNTPLVPHDFAATPEHLRF